MNVKKWSLILFFVIGSMLSACSTEESHDEGEHQQTKTSSGDIQEATASTEVLPSFLEGKSEDMQAIYQASAEHEALLTKMPCYCGCGESAGHKSNYNCFVDERSDEEVVWDDHGTKCGVCLEIAAQAVLDYRDGESIEDIRSDIEKTYQEDYAEPTPTPEV
ncbi:PCYCGC motif-containing (lipo)protein [Thalassobacillus sp. CUG 92003]|uniref:PCYCGC motif-containing (lipo)protein n=1 Tax=Thalassobacillus sp. CUG 92003 TaxID=2736641 RepID=UPI0015E68ABA|nr:PCYCGC motif-containing (lipo)protein [Thalassobacillus sp. CUG 92003]